MVAHPKDRVKVILDAASELASTSLQEEGNARGEALIGQISAFEVRGRGYFPLTHLTTSQPTDSYEDAYNKTREQMERLRLGVDQLRRTCGLATMRDPNHPIKSISQTLIIRCCEFSFIPCSRRY